MVRQRDQVHAGLGGAISHLGLSSSDGVTVSDQPRSGNIRP
jgi:hypothetical protein